MRRFSWVPSIAKGITGVLTWFMAPLKVIGLLLDIGCALIFLGGIAYIVGIFTGYVPDSQVNAILDTVGHKIEHHIIPEKLISKKTGDRGSNSSRLQIPVSHDITQ